MRNSSASRTAYLIAESAVYLSFERKYDSVFPKNYLKLCRVFAESRPLRKKLLFYLNHFYLFRRFYLHIQEKAVPGIRQHYLLRKKRIEELTREKIGQGYTQIVILGAGFDTLALRLADEFPRIKFIEVDHPSTQLDKLKAVSPANSNLHFISADLASSQISSVLEKCPLYNPLESTLFIAEGLLMYLSELEISKLFNSIHRVSRSTSAFLFTAMERSENGQIRFQGASRLVDLWLQIYGEPFKWGLAKCDIADFLSNLNFQLESITGHYDLRLRYMNDPNFNNEPLAQGEFICLAIRKGTKNDPDKTNA